MTHSLAATQTVLPSLSKQKTFIAENAGILNRETKIAILRIVMQEVEGKAVMENSGTKEVDIDLDACAESNEDVIHHIYNMVKARLDSLNQPAGRNVGQQRGRGDAEDDQQASSSSAGAGQGPSAATEPPKSAVTTAVAPTAQAPRTATIAKAATGRTTAVSVAARRKEPAKK